MNVARLAVIAVTILAWGVFVPVAMASSDCMAMCDGPCGVPASTVSAPAAPPVIALVTPAYVEAVSSTVAIDPRSPEPPPK